MDKKCCEPKFPKPGLCGRGFNFSSGEGGGLIKLNWNLLSVLYLQEKRGKIRYSKILSKLSPRISSHKVLEVFYSFATGVFVLVFTKRRV
jgi:hypothetical protein